MLVNLALHALPQVWQCEGSRKIAFLSRKIAFLPCITPASFLGSGITDEDTK